MLPLRHLVRRQLWPRNRAMSPKSEPSAAAARLQAVTRSLSSASPTSAADAHHAARPLLGHLTLDKLHLPVYETEDKARLPREDLLLDSHDPVVVAELAWLMKKWDLRTCDAS